MAPLTDTRPPRPDPAGRLADAERARAWLSELVPDLTTTTETMADRFDEPNEIVRFRSSPNAMCRFVVEPDFSRSNVVYLLPIRATVHTLQPVLRACLLDALDHFPQAGPSPVRGTFGPGKAGKRKALVWQLLFPDSDVIEELSANVATPAPARWVITMGTLTGAATAARRWRV